ncbi:hypothetical protein LINPERHAP1_LOCUS24938 [Linum perenne]
MTKYSTKTVWELIGPKAGVVTWCSLVWSGCAIPRNSFLLWLIVLGRLATNESMVAWGISLDISCVLRTDGVDSKKHLF